MVGWHHRLNGHEFEQTLGDTERQGSLVGYSSWGCEELDITERLNNNSDSGKTAYPKLKATPTATEWRNLIFIVLFLKKLMCAPRSVWPQISRSSCMSNKGRGMGRL